VRAVTGFDRVMAYQFHPDGHGEVVAEALSPGQDPYLGLHYPASDIPRQARALYLRQWLRLIVDVNYRPAALVPERNPRTGRPLDLGLAALRSVSPIHLQYLRNMRVSASMSVSLIVDDDLWGLIACHHRTPRRVGYAVRGLCEVLGRLVSAQLAAHRQHAAFAVQLEAKRRHAELVEQMADLDALARGLAEGRTSGLDLVAADGLVARIDGALATTGIAPPALEADRLVAGVRHDHGAGVFATDALGEHYPELAHLASVASGALVVPLQAPGEYVTWFRREAVRTVDWAGDPRKATGRDGLSPRASFARWSETVRGRSRRWSAVEIEAAGVLRRAISDLQLRRAQAELARMSLHDPLTGLPNRRLLMDRLEHALARAERSGLPPTLLFIDLDRFKLVNDLGGHDAGDTALVEAARRLARLTRAADTVARLGGDEFVLLCEEADPGDVAQLAERIVEAFTAPFAIDGREWTITASVGVARADAESQPQALLAKADRAMYRSKRAGRSRSSG
jgi:diguanylate cyclase (GGDEF)-like protein